MALKIKVKAPKITQFDLSPKAELIDEVGEMTADAEKIKAKIKELTASLAPYTERLKELQTYISGEGNQEEPLTLYGEKFMVVGGACAVEREIADIDKIVEMVGPETFLKIAKVPLKAVDDYLTPEQKEQVLSSSFGVRKIKVEARKE